MTKTHEEGESEITLEVKREARKTNRDVCDILREMREAAKRSRDKDLLGKIIAAEKFLNCRNRRKRRR